MNLTRKSMALGFLAATSLMGCVATNPARQQEIVATSEKHKICLKPADDVLEVSQGLTAEISMARNGADAKAVADYNRKFERVRQEDHAAQKLEVLNYNLCLDYTEGRISKEIYEELYKKNFQEALDSKK